MQVSANILWKGLDNKYFGFEGHLVPMKLLSSAVVVQKLP